MGHGLKGMLVGNRRRAEDGLTASFDTSIAEKAWIDQGGVFAIPLKISVKADTRRINAACDCYLTSNITLSTDSTLVVTLSWSLRTTMSQRWYNIAVSETCVLPSPPRLQPLVEFLSLVTSHVAQNASGQRHTSVQPICKGSRGLNFGHERKILPLGRQRP